VAFAVVMLVKALVVVFVSVVLMFRLVILAVPPCFWHMARTLRLKVTHLGPICLSQNMGSGAWSSFLLSWRK
jgi:hypothetical protein